MLTQPCNVRQTEGQAGWICFGKMVSLLAGIASQQLLSGKTSAPRSTNLLERSLLKSNYNNDDNDEDEDS